MIGYKWSGPEQLVKDLVPINSVQVHPRNVRRGNVDVLARSMQKYGQMSRIVVQKSTGHICKGNHTYKAAVLLGWDVIAADLVDMDDDTAYGYLLADNRASDLAEYDKAALARSLQEFADKGTLHETLWTADDMDDVQQAIGTLETLAQEFKGDYSDDPVKRQERLERELTRIAPKMREVPVVITVDQHQVFMENIRVCQRAWFTGGAIETILLAVQKAADTIRGEAPAEAPEQTAHKAPQSPNVAAPPPVPTPPLVGPQRGAQALPGAIEPPAAGVPNAAIAEAARKAVRQRVRNQIVNGLKALGEPTVKRAVVWALLEGIQPNRDHMTDEQRIRREAVTDVRGDIMATLNGDELNVDDLIGLTDNMLGDYDFRA